MNKYTYFWIIQGRTKGRWEEVYKHPSRRETIKALYDLMNNGHSHDAYRMLGARRRELNPDYKEQS